MPLFPEEVEEKESEREHIRFLTEREERENAFVFVSLSTLSRCISISTTISFLPPPPSFLIVWGVRQREFFIFIFIHRNSRSVST